MKITSMKRECVTPWNAAGKRLGTLAISAVFLLGAQAVTATANAQAVVSMTRSMGGPGGDSAISKRAVDRYARVLSFSDEQKEQAMAIHSGYASAMEGRQKAFREALDEIRRTSEDSGDHTVFMERLPKIEKERAQASKKLEADFFTDLKALTAGKQEEAWPRVERMRRRETGMAGGGLSGEGMDVVELVDELKLDGEAAKAVALVLDGYELEMDRLLVAKAAKADDDQGFEPGKPIDIEKLQEAMAKSREQGAKVRDLNRETARKVQDLLPEDRKQAFEVAVRKRTFPRVYKTPRVSREFDAALAMSDLSGSQKEQLNELRSSYERDLEPANTAWSRAIEENEKSGQGGALGGGGGGQISLAFGDDPEPLKDVRKARRELDEGASKKLRSILNDDQRSKLPKPTEADEAGGMVSGGQIMMIRRDE
ncbi:MAG: hypothetical protein NTV94_07245 [Planctomycetota bacterium]|nr:hypothetical protein [Planctomycetota bacterium]